MAVEVHQHVDAVAADHGRDHQVGDGLDRAEADVVARGLQGLVVDVAEHLELVGVVVVEQRYEEVARLVVAEAGAHVADPQPPSGVRPHRKDRLSGGERLGPQARPFPRGLRLAARTVLDEEQAEEAEGAHGGRGPQGVVGLERVVGLFHPSLVMQGLGQHEHAVGPRDLGIGDRRAQGHDGRAHEEGLVEVAPDRHGVGGVGQQPLQVHAQRMHQVQGMGAARPLQHGLAAGLIAAGQEGGGARVEHIGMRGVLGHQQARQLRCERALPVGQGLHRGLQNLGWVERFGRLGFR